MEFHEHLSSYYIFEGNPALLQPGNGFHEYELATALFTDHAQKQRLIHIPPGKQMKPMGDALPEFPDGTILVKTFFYQHDKRDTSKGRRPIETRLLVLESGVWNVATYLWNDAQTDAVLLAGGSTLPIEWINDLGEQMNVNYEVPNERQCATCHNKNERVIPIGPKLRNLNMTVRSNDHEINQLDLLMQRELLETFDHTSMTATPDWKDNGESMENRVRAYLDINCAHCHQPSGFAENINLNLDYTVSFQKTNIERKKRQIERRMENGSMPYLGTTVVDEEALTLIRQYLETL